MSKVRKERTRWRDLELSQRHREWGYDCPALDIDFLLIEYDRGEAIALVEYKHESAKPQYSSHPTYRALIDLGTRAGIPVFACRYKSDFSEWKVVALNHMAEKSLSKKIVVMSESEWVTLLYKLRSRKPPEYILNNLKHQFKGE